MNTVGPWGEEERNEAAQLNIKYQRVAQLRSSRKYTETSSGINQLARCFYHPRKVGANAR